jgi:hypothetical protein
MIRGSPVFRATPAAESGDWPVQRHAQPAGLIMVAPPATATDGQESERWPAPVATLFIVTTSLALWAGIFFIGGKLLG